MCKIPYIYQIRNKANGKSYVGKTLKTVEIRWKEHCAEALKERHKDRPLYRAIRKYGVDNFELSILEEVTNVNTINDREVYWIDALGTFRNGYNATKGGNGRYLADYDPIYQLWDDGLNVDEISSVLNHDCGTIRSALDRKNITLKDRKERGIETVITPVAQLDKDTLEVIHVFPSIKQAYAHLNKEQSGHIASVCTGKRNSAYGYKWRYIY